nr:hypothetical protein [Kofleriaceae bacterium]
MGDIKLEMAATPRHRVRMTVTRLLRADEMATLLRDLLAAIRSDDVETILLAEWGDALVEALPSGAVLDLHGVGVIAFRLLTGHLPTPATRYVPGAPPALATLILHMLVGDPGARPTVRDADLAIAVMLGEVLPETFEVVDSFDSFDDEIADAGATSQPPPKPVSDSQPNLRKLKWTPPTHLATATRAASLRPPARPSKPKLV